MFISPVPRAARPGLGRRLLNSRTLVMIGGVGILLVWIVAAAIFISNNKDTEYLNISTNSKLKDRAKFRGPHTAAQSKAPTHDKQEILDGGQENTTDESEKSGMPDWWASDSVLDERTKERREAVRQAFAHAWGGYKKYAWGHDEVRPVSKTADDGWGGMGATLVDSLDTALIMGFTEEFKEAVEHVRGMTFDSNWDGSTFETTIRYLGGLLAAHELSGEKVLLEKAKLLADRMLPAFQTQTGIPYATVNLQTGHAYSPSWSGGSSFLAEFGTLQLEWNKLAHLTGEKAYSDRMDKIDNAMLSVDTSQWDGLYPSAYHPDQGRFTSNHITFGARGDSFYEYLMKSWLITGKKNGKLREAYLKAMKGMQKRLIFRTSLGNLTWIAEEDGRIISKMDHLACFVPGMLALDDVPEHLNLAREILQTCIESYERSPTGLAPEIIGFDENQVQAHHLQDFWYQAPHNLLRPETAESLMVLYRVTRDESYREAGWKMFQAFEKECKTDAAYSGVRDVTRVGSGKDDKMESFFLAETLKYLYLLFSPVEHVSLKKFVFNTEAHPLRKY
eukprot:TRINITY_DN5796_c0_g1_i1.p1 TRINITY_DN5796_c0_g1~~TRINITY_DN5796_c0_g1_i1.p1  ORF type:complete len:561 (-),score=93.02 TRINITY_DN5796_c0_g1_i1:51-1733(-)